MSETRTITPASQPAPPHSSENGHGKPADFGSAFAEALLSAARDESPAGPGDVPVAIALGWYLAALAHPGDAVDCAVAVRGDFTGVAALTTGQVVDFCHSQVQVAFARLRKLVEKADASLPDLTELDECIKAGPEDARRAAAGELDSRTLATLSAVDFRLGKGYGIGRALMNLTTCPAPGTTLAEHLTEARIAPIVAGIDDLSSVLLQHAGHSVRASLLEWQASIATASPVAPESPDTWLLLARQGEVWRVLLSGEKSGLDMLEVDDYLDAAQRLSKRVRTMGRRLVRQFPEVWAAIGLLLVTGVGLVVLVDGAGAIVTGAAAILASLGLTWRGAGRSLGGLTAKVEKPLWGAELDTAIKQAITLLPRELGRDVTAERRGVAVALGHRAD